MNHDTEIDALRKHFARRGLDTADAMSIISTWAGINIGLAAPDDAGVNHRVSILTTWISDAALHIVRTIDGGSTGGRLQ